MVYKGFINILTARQVDTLKLTIGYINFLASLLASDKPADQRSRDCNKRVVVHSSRGGSTLSVVSG